MFVAVHATVLWVCIFSYPNHERKLAEKGAADGVETNERRTPFPNNNYKR